MAHAHKPDFVFRRNGRVHLNRRGRHFSRMLAAEMCAISVSNAGYTMFRLSVKGTGYPLHSPVSPSLPIPCATVCHQVSNALYNAAGFEMLIFRRNFRHKSTLIPAQYKRTTKYWDRKSRLSKTRQVIKLLPLCQSISQLPDSGSKHIYPDYS